MIGLIKTYLEQVEKHWYYFAQEQESRDQSKRGLLGGRGLREFDAKLRDYAVRACTGRQNGTQTSRRTQARRGRASCGVRQ
jgi:hypothetical protein